MCVYIYIYIYTYIHIYVNVNINVSINDYSFKYICVVYYLKLHVYCLTYSVTNFRDFNS